MNTRRVAIVTGGSRGIGAAIVQQLFIDGFLVAFCFKSNKEMADVIVAKCADSSRVFAMQCDIGNQADIARFVDMVMAKWARVDVLVNCAGAILPESNWRTMSRVTLGHTFDSNFFGAVMMTQAVGSLLQASKTGTIVNIGSVFGLLGAGAVAAYTASKAALHDFTRALAKDLAPSVTVNCIAPGTIDTDMTRAAGPDIIQRIIDETPMRRLGEPEEVASLVSFLVSEKARFLTGQIIPLDGGYSLK
jgi:3-oxoacyl-[acyl-carrier protein] reductase